jgi:hypothetical protein
MANVTVTPHTHLSLFFLSLFFFFLQLLFIMSMQVEETGTTQPVAGIIYPPPDVRRKVTQ